jgi:hypothetical protein
MALCRAREGGFVLRQRRWRLALGEEAHVVVEFVGESIVVQRVTPVPTYW